MEVKGQLARQPRLHSLSMGCSHKGWATATKNATLMFPPPGSTREKNASFFQLHFNDILGKDVCLSQLGSLASLGSITVARKGRGHE